jgi:nicotine blue oxidoreductase
VTGAADVIVAGARTVPNPDWHTGMASSLRAGLAALAAMPDPPGAAIVGLVDQPGIGPEVVRRLIGAYEAGARIAVATYGGEQRNPVLFARATWSDVAASVTGDRGARDYLAARGDDVTEVECGDVADPADLDTAEDVAAWGRRQH